MKKLYYSLLPLLVISCAWGARTRITADQALYPVSMSRGVRDQNGEIVSAERRQVVGQFQYKKRTWSTFYTLVPITPRRNISKAVNAQVQQAGGDAIINLTTIVQSCRLPNYVVLFNLLPIWPSCAKVSVYGDIIKVLPAAPTPPTPPDGNPTTPPVNPTP